MPVGKAAPIADERVAGTGRTEKYRDTSVPVHRVRRALFPFWNWAIANVGGQRGPEGGEFRGDWWAGGRDSGEWLVASGWWRAARMKRDSSAALGMTRQWRVASGEWEDEERFLGCGRNDERLVASGRTKRDSSAALGMTRQWLVASGWWRAARTKRDSSAALGMTRLRPRGRATDRKS